MGLLKKGKGRFSKENRKKWFQKWKYRLDNLSIRSSLFVYTVFFLLLSTALTAIVIQIADNLYYNILFNYRVDTNDGNYYFTTANVSTVDSLLLSIANIFRNFAIPLVFGGCMLYASFLFYRKKLKVPLTILNHAAQNIAENNLDFNIIYDNKDELGKLCSAFETMRYSLEQNNKQMWRTMEERKRLNAAFSHDLRTPLTVLKGYTDYLKNYIPQDKVDKEKLISTVTTMGEHVARLEQYVATMNTVQRLEDIRPEKKVIELTPFACKIKESLKMLEPGGITIAVSCLFTNQMMALDEKIVMQVVENLVSNALCYAKKEILVTLDRQEENFVLTVSDDGKGFTEEELRQATKAFYKDKSHANSAHFGLGLNICKVLCEKHGGTLQLGNNAFHGAVVTASFSGLFSS